MNRSKLEAIIVDGDAQATVERAKALGEQLARRLKTNQIRNIFGTVRRIEMTWPVEPHDEAQQRQAQQARRELILLKPKMAYQAKRASEVRPLAEVLTRGVDLVVTGEEDERQRFQHFVDFFEAVLAYHKAHGGN
jgi:CRISPR-associated protein Csm2